jgi:OmpA-OmpF porin, OOP family
VASILQDNLSLRIRIEGHTDSVGSERYNQRLSQLRSNAIRKFLVDRGVDGARLEAIGFGEATPIADNKTAEGRAKNRRVEFNILGGSAEGMPPLP